MPDDRDLAILTALQDDARATFADVGAKVGLSASAVHDRVRKLEQQGAIRGYRAIVDPEALGLFVTALIAVIPLDPHQPDDLPTRVREFPEVEDCYSVAGEANYVLKVRTGTTGDLEDLDQAAPREGRRHDEHHDRPLDPLRGPSLPHLSSRVASRSAEAS